MAQDPIAGNGYSTHHAEVGNLLSPRRTMHRLDTDAPVVGRFSHSEEKFRAEERGPSVCRIDPGIGLDLLGTHGALHKRCCCLCQKLRLRWDGGGTLYTRLLFGPRFEGTS